jgi:hypothetical protein
MKFRVIVCGALVAIVAVVPTAAARAHGTQGPQRTSTTQGGITLNEFSTSIAAEIARDGIKAPVATWAPELYKAAEAPVFALHPIWRQLGDLDGEMQVLLAHQRALGARGCTTQAAAVATPAHEISRWYATLYELFHIHDKASRDSRLESLFADRHRMHAAQIQLHDSLAGIDVPNLIHACGRHIEESEYPFLSSYVEHEVWNFWAVYRTAAAELLVVRANMMALHPDQLAANKAEEAARIAQRDWFTEQSFIKPAFPAHISYDKLTGEIWLSSSVPHGWSQLDSYQQHRWRFTGYSTTPTCAAVATEFAKTGLTGRAAIEQMRRFRVIRLAPGTDTILCDDGKEQLFDFDIAIGTYRSVSASQATAESLGERANVINGEPYVRTAEFAYTG